MNVALQSQSRGASQPIAQRKSGAAFLQRSCACGGSAGLSGDCEDCDKNRLSLQRSTQSSEFDTSDSGEVPGIVHDVLRSPGQPLEPGTRAFFEPRFGHDFSRVQVHVDSQATQSAQAVDSLAYTVGRNIVFGPGAYRPTSAEGQRLIAHELVHVMQQSASPDLPADGRLALGPSNSPEESEAQSVSAGAIRGSAGDANADSGSGAFMIRRADPDAVGQILKLRTVVGAAIQFWPTNVVDTQIGPVTVQGGLLNSAASRLNVIIGQNLTPRILAREILPLWTTATPFTPLGGGAPVPPGPLTELQLAQGLLVYNQYYLPVPAMTEWRAGLRFPLPAEIDEVTGMATVNADLIRSLAGAFDPAWMPLLDQRASATVAPPVATVQADATAFLAAEPTTLGRGVALGARAITNAQAQLPFIREVFNQLGAASFDVALETINELVNHDLGMLAAQRDGAAILAVLRNALAVVPAGITADQQTNLTRANAMLARVAGVVAANPSAAMPTRAEKAVTVDTVKLDGSRFNPKTQVEVASAIYAQCNVRIDHGVDATATNPQTTGWLGADLALQRPPGLGCGNISVEETALYQGAAAAFGLGARFRAFFVSNITGYNASGYSFPPLCGAPALFRNAIVVQNSGDDSTLAHELGHILLNSIGHPANTLMQPRPRPNEITDPQCTTIYNNA